MKHGGHGEHLANDDRKGALRQYRDGGMFTVVKVRDNLKSYDEDAGWYRHPEGTAALRVGEPKTGK